MSLATRFWAKVDKRGPDDCWPWTAARHSEGYGSVGIEGTVTDRAHRVSWLLHNGPIPKNMFVLHSCDNPPCVNPAHLWLGTRAENNTDRARKGRSAVGDRHGSRTHPEAYRGETRPTAKLREAEVCLIRRLAAEGTPRAVLARDFGVNVDAIGRIARYASWSHLP